MRWIAIHERSRSRPSRLRGSSVTGALRDGSAWEQAVPTVAAPQTCRSRAPLRPTPAREVTRRPPLKCKKMMRYVRGTRTRTHTDIKLLLYYIILFYNILFGGYGLRRDGFNQRARAIYPGGGSRACSSLRSRAHVYL